MAANFKLVLLFSAILTVLAQQKPKTCEVARFRTQANFNLKEFMGEWHVISDKEIFPHQHRLDKIVDVFTNIRVYGILRASHQVDLTVVSRVMGICVTSLLTAERTDFKTPAKLEASSPDAWWSYMKKAHPVWVAWTDGDAALVYSCGQEADDGSCDPHHTHSWTLNRHADGHTPAQQRAIDDKITQFCMDPADFKDMKRSWPCSEFDVAALEEEDDDDDNDQADDGNPEDDTNGADAGDDTADDADGEEDQVEDEDLAADDEEEDLTAEDEEGADEGDEGEGEEGEEDENGHKAEL